jgi:hypothetical protein
MKEIRILIQNLDLKKKNFDILSDIKTRTWLRKRIMHAM